MDSVNEPGRVPYVYVLVRADLTPEQRLVQAGHALLEAGFRFRRPPAPVNLVVLQVADEPALLEAAASLAARGIEHEVFFEPDKDVGHSALATRPLIGNTERRIFRCYPLYVSRPRAANQALEVAM